MPLTELQREVCRLIADNRVRSGESYVAGATALNELLGAERLSRDIDLFHDSDEALRSTWDGDRRLLADSGFTLAVTRERPAFVEATVSNGTETVALEWARDSAYRFFPLVEHPDFGLTLHPFDLATNKVLALAGRLEVRDWIDVLGCDERLQPLGYLAWAACGKDPGLTPQGILEHAARTHYSAAEVLSLAYAGGPPDPAQLSRRWKKLAAEARAVAAALPAAQVGKAVLSRDGTLFRGDAAALAAALASDALLFHEGSIRGALPRLADAEP